MTKLCMVVHQSYYLDGRVRRYAESLAEQGVHVDVICVQNDDPRPADYPDNIRVYPIPVGRSSSGQDNYIVEYGISLIFYCLWVLGLYFRNWYHVIHVHNMPDFLTLSAFIPRLLGAKIILDIHDPMPEFYMSKFETDTASGMVRLMIWQERLSCWIAQAIMTANPNFKKNLIQRGIQEEKISVVMNMPDRRIFDRTRYTAEREAAHDRFTLVYAGTIAPRYGLDLPIRALPAIKAVIPDVRLIIIGKQVAHAQELAELAAKLGVSDSLELKSAVPITQVPGYLSMADLGFYTAYPDAHMSIATPSKVLEYVVMGVPIVAARLPVLESLFSEESIAFFPPGDESIFAAHVIRLYENPEQRAALVQSADQSFARYATWDHEFETYARALNKLLGRSIVEGENE